MVKEKFGACLECLVPPRGYRDVVMEVDIRNPFRQIVQMKLHVRDSYAVCEPSDAPEMNKPARVLGGPTGRLFQ